ncbi:MAG: zinc-ribbon domain-containing protein [Gammaproteobacteria bacterium]|nr:zinc-ribbon domain-containing protein [Gammaproteobacteria bacterium]
MQTQCPHCQTVFKVSDEHLKAAEGFVRCGICNEVFNVLKADRPVAKKEPAAQTKTVVTTQAATKKIIKPDKTDPVDLILEQSDVVSTNDDMGRPSASKVISDKKEAMPAKKVASPDNTQTDLFSGSAKPEPKSAPVNSNIAQAKTIRTEAIKTETVKPEEIKPRTPAIKTPVTEIKSQSAAKPVEKVQVHKETNNIAKQPSAVIAPVTATPSVSGTTRTGSSSNSRNMDNSLFDGVQSKLIPDEYRIPVLHNTYSLWRDLAWSLAILVVTASLLLEYTWFNRNELIRDHQLRPLVTQFCIIANCDTMNLREPGEIEMTTRNIYSHPNVKNALMISGTLINHARFEQPYPDILIDFSDVRGEVIASRVFTPEDYLQIKNTSLRNLAPQVSIDFNMEIQDPGNNAMTYEFSFL